MAHIGQIPPHGVAPERSWQDLGPYLLHDARVYAEWLGPLDVVVKSTAKTVDELRDERGPYRIFTPDEAAAYVREHGVLVTQPLCGGMPPALAWPSLELIAGRVLPAVTAGSPA